MSGSGRITSPHFPSWFLWAWWEPGLLRNRILESCVEVPAAEVLSNSFCRADSMAWEWQLKQNIDIATSNQPVYNQSNLKNSFIQSSEILVKKNLRPQPWKGPHFKWPWWVFFFGVAPFSGRSVRCRSGVAGSGAESQLAVAFIGILLAIAP